MDGGIGCADYTGTEYRIPAEGFCSTSQSSLVGWKKGQRRTPCLTGRQMVLFRQLYKFKISAKPSEILLEPLKTRTAATSQANLYHATPIVLSRLKSLILYGHIRPYMTTCPDNLSNPHAQKWSCKEIATRCHRLARSAYMLFKWCGW